MLMLEDRWKIETRPKLEHQHSVRNFRFDYSTLCKALAIYRAVRREDTKDDVCDCSYLGKALFFGYDEKMRGTCLIVSQQKDPRLSSQSRVRVRVSLPLCSQSSHELLSQTVVEHS